MVTDGVSDIEWHSVMIEKVDCPEGYALNMEGDYVCERCVEPLSLSASCPGPLTPNSSLPASARDL